MRQFFEEAQPDVVEVFDVGLVGFAQNQTFEAGVTLAIVGTDLGEQPMRFAAAASAAIANPLGAAGLIAKPGGGAGGKLPRLENDVGAGEVRDLVEWTTGALSFVNVVLKRHVVSCFRCGGLGASASC